MKEISKIYNDIIVGQTDPLIGADQFEPGLPLLNPGSPSGYEVDENGTVYSGYQFDVRVGQRFSPCGGLSGNDCNQPPLLWSGEDKQPNDTAIGPGADHNASKNIPYYYFGLNQGKTAIEKLRNKFFVN